MRSTSRLPIIMAMLLGAGAVQAAAPAADLIIRHARIWTGTPTLPEAESLAVLDERIVAIGSDRDTAGWKGPGTLVVEAGGRRIVPGFNDAHVHFSDGGAALEAVQLNDAATPEAFVERLRMHARSLAPGRWILQGEWDETKWPSKELPTRQLVDAVTPANPVAVSRYDGHLVLANSLALRLAGITAATADPVGGVIVRDAKGEPTGALKDAAINLLNGVIPDASHDERRHVFVTALQHAASIGVTSMQDMNPSYGDLAMYAELRREGRLTARIYAVPAVEGVEDQAKLGIGAAFGDAWLRIGAVKAYADGSLGSRTAYFFEPYADQPGERGLLADTMQPLSRMRDYYLRADATRLQVCTHAIGDAAISQTLDLYAEVMAAGGPRDRRWRIEHAQHVAAKDLDRFASLGVIASMQPTHAIDDGRWAEGRIGHDRSSRTYAFRTLLDHGARLAFGTDWPVAPLDPLLSLYAATTRATLDGRNPGGWFPEQKLTVSEALSIYTAGSAYAEFQERDKGTLATGKLADFVMLSEDLLAVPSAHIRDIRVLKTWVGGKLVYERR